MLDATNGIWGYLGPTSLKVIGLRNGLRGHLVIKKLSYFYYWIKEKYGLVEELWPMRVEPCFCVNFDMFVTGTKLTANNNNLTIVLISDIVPIIL